VTYCPYCCRPVTRKNATFCTPECAKANAAYEARERAAKIRANLIPAGQLTIPELRRSVRNKLPFGSVR